MNMYLLVHFSFKMMVCYRVFTVIQEQVWEADVGILLTRVDYLV